MEHCISKIWCRRFISTSLGLKKRVGNSSRAGSCTVKTNDFKRFDKKLTRLFTTNMLKMDLRNEGIDDTKLLLATSRHGRLTFVDEKRKHHLNVIYAEHLMQVLSTHAELSVLDISLSRVSMSPDMSKVSIYWIAQGDGADGQREQLLEHYSDAIRSRLTETRVLGFVPPLNFVKDRTQVHLNEMNELFAKADYGVHYLGVSKVASTLGRAQSVQSQPTKQQKVPPWVKKAQEKRKQREQENSSDAVGEEGVRASETGGSDKS